MSEIVGTLEFLGGFDARNSLFLPFLKAFLPVGPKRRPKSKNDALHFRFSNELRVKIGRKKSGKNPGEIRKIREKSGFQIGLDHQIALGLLPQKLV